MTEDETEELKSKTYMYNQIGRFFEAATKAVDDLMQIAIEAQQRQSRRQ